MLQSRSQKAGVSLNHRCGGWVWLGKPFRYPIGYNNKVEARRFYSSLGPGRKERVDWPRKV